MMESASSDQHPATAHCLARIICLFKKGFP